MLKRHPLLKKRIELQNKGYFPSCTTWYEENAHKGEYISSTEKYGILRAQSYWKIKPIEEALKILGDSERDVIEQSYFQPNKPNLGTLCQQCGLSERNYFRIKRDALEKLAFVLGFKD